MCRVEFVLFDVLDPTPVNAPSPRPLRHASKVPQGTDARTPPVAESEESGIPGLRIDTVMAALHVHPVTCSLGVPTRHLDLQFIGHAPVGAEIVCSDESLDLRWWPLDALPDDTDFGLAQLAAAVISSGATVSISKQQPQLSLT